MDAIFFDIDDTLYDLAQPYLRAFEAVYAGTLGIVPEELFAASRVHSDERFGEMSTGKITLDEYHADRVQRTFAEERSQRSPTNFQYSSPVSCQRFTTPVTTYET